MMKTKKLTTIALLCAMAVVVNFVIPPLSMVPSVPFLKYDPSDIVVLIGGFIYGPISALIISTITSILEIFYHGGTPIDILMNVISSAAFACSAAYIYKQMHSKKGAIIGLSVGIILVVLVMLLWNYIVTPIYFGIPRDGVVAMLPAIALSNFLKAALNSGIALLIYKPIVTIFRRIDLVEDDHSHRFSASGLFIVGIFIVITILGIVSILQGWI